MRHTLSDNEPRIVLNDGTVSYNDRPILHHLSWRVNPGNTGKSSAPTVGKSTLLSLITGDHPRGYSNDLTCLAAAGAAVKLSGISKTYWLCQQPASGLPGKHDSSQRYSLRLFRFNRHLSGRLHPTGSTSWYNSGWIFWASINIPRMHHFIVFPGGSSGWY